MPMERWSDDPLWECGEPSDEAVRLFTEGDCWWLSWHVTLLTGRRIHTLGWWDHVVVLVGPDAFLDIEGLHTRAELRSRWMGNRVIPLDERHTTSWAAYVDGLGAARAFRIDHGEVRDVAEGLVAKWCAREPLAVGA